MCVYGGGGEVGVGGVMCVCGGGRRSGGCNVCMCV